MEVRQALSRKNEQFKARDKKTHRMGRDGLVEINQTTGEETRVSQRGQEFELKREAAPGAESARAAPGGHDADSAHRHRQTVPQDDTVQQGNEQATDTATHNAGQATQAPPPPVRASARGGHAQAAATVAATQGGKRRPARPQARTPTPQPKNGAGTPEPSARLRFGGTEQAPQPAPARRRGTEYQRKFTDEGAAPEQAAQPTERPESNPRLQFAADEKPPEALGDKLTGSRRKASRPDTGDHRLDKATRKTDKVEGKLGDAREKLPAKRRIRVDKAYDGQKEKTVRKLRFEKQVKTQREHLRGPLPLRPVKAGANAAVGYGHKKIYEVERENVGTQAAHKGEIAAEGVARTAYRFHKTRPYRRVARLERAAAKAHIRLDYAQALRDNPKLRSNLLSRFMQKQKIKRQYAKAAREAKKAASRAKRAGDTLSRAFSAVAGFVKRHPALVAGILALLLLLAIIMALFSSCSNMAGGTLSSVFMSSYLAEDGDINDAELSYTRWETDLLLQVQNAEADWPGYDECAATRCCK
jgi:hypothetical protein